MSTLKRFAVAASTVATLALLQPSAHAANFELTNDGAWFDFSLVEGSASWLDAASEAASFSFSSSDPFALRVVDYFIPGDSTQVFANGNLLGATPAVAFNDALFAATPDAALGATEWSHSTWVLGPGTYTFTGVPVDIPFGAATMAISVTAVPEPSAAGMLLGGLGVLMAFGLRKRYG